MFYVFKSENNRRAIITNFKKKKKDKQTNKKPTFLSEAVNVYPNTMRWKQFYQYMKFTKERSPVLQKATRKSLDPKKTKLTNNFSHLFGASFMIIKYPSIQPPVVQQDLMVLKVIGRKT